MKKLLFAVLLVPLFVCGCTVSSGEQDDDDKKNEQLEYKVESFDIYYPDADMAIASYYYNGKFIFYGGNSEDSQYGVWIYDINEQEQKLLYSVDETESIYSLCADDSKIVVLSCQYDDIGGASWTLCSVTYEGEQSKYADVTENSQADYSLSSLCCDKNGNVYLSADDGVFVWDDKLNYLGYVKLEYISEWLCVSEDDGVFAVGINSTGLCVSSVVLLKSEMLLSDIAITDIADISDRVIDNSLFVYGGYTVSEVDLKDGKITELSDADAFYAPSFYNILCTSEQENQVLVYPMQGSKKLIVEKIGKSNAEDDDNKQILTLGIIGSDGDFWESVALFNTVHDDVQIEVKTYQYTVPENGELSEFSKDLIDGKVPDIMIMNSSMMSYNLVELGIFADLRDFLASDEEMSEDSFVDGILEAYTYKDCLYAIPDSFSIITCIGISSVWSASDKADLSNVEALLNDNNEMRLTTLKESSEELLRMLVSGGTRMLVSEDGVSVNEEEIKAVIRFAKQYSTEIDDGVQYENMADALVDEKVLIGMAVSLDQWTLKESGWANLDNDEISLKFVGFPSIKAAESYYEVGNEFAISSVCSNKEAAWDFVREVFLEPVQTAVNTEMYPVNKASLADIISDMGLSDDMRESLERVIEETHYVYETNSDTIDIIAEEAAGYFENEKSLDEVAQAAYERLLLYASENN